MRSQFVTYKHQHYIYKSAALLKVKRAFSHLASFFSVDKTVCVVLPDTSRLGCDVLVTCAGHYIFKATVSRAIRVLKTVEGVP